MQESTAVIRHAIMAWRDHQFMTAHGLLNTAAIAARQAFEMSLKDATFRDSAWLPLCRCLFRAPERGRHGNGHGPQSFRD